jgi:hypothetical protein
VVARTRSFEQRVERRSATLRRVVERVRRVEQAPMHARALVQLTAGASTPRRDGVPIAGLLAPLPRVLQRPATLGTVSVAAPEAPAPPRARAQAAPPPIDVARLTDEVMRGIDRRIAAWRERRGRV